MGLAMTEHPFVLEMSNFTGKWSAYDSMFTKGKIRSRMENVKNWPIQLNWTILRGTIRLAHLYKWLVVLLQERQRKRGEDRYGREGRRDGREGDQGGRQEEEAKDPARHAPRPGLPGLSGNGGLDKLLFIV